MSAWRIGHIKNPCTFRPQAEYAWNNRFDDILKVYRTIYCAREILTCFRELLADFRPNEKAIGEFQKMFGEKPPSAGVVLEEWYDKHVLVSVKIKLKEGALVDIENTDESARLKSKHPSFFAGIGIDEMSIARLRKRDRRVTQYISRLYYDQGKSGIQFRSHTDDGVCTALFEGRALLQSLDKPIRITHDMIEFKQVCVEYNLIVV